MSTRNKKKVRKGNSKCKSNKKTSYAGKKKPNTTLITIVEDKDIRRQRQLINKNKNKNMQKQKPKQPQSTDDSPEPQSPSIPPLSQSNSIEEENTENEESDSVGALFTQFNAQVSKNKFAFNDEEITDLKSLDYGSKHIVDFFQDRQGMNDFIAEAKQENIDIKKCKYYEFYIYCKPHTPMAAPIPTQSKVNESKINEEEIPKTKRNTEFKYDFDSDNPDYTPLIQLYENNELILPEISGQVTYSIRHHLVFELISIICQYEQLKQMNVKNKKKNKVTRKQAYNGIISESNWTHRRHHYSLMAISFNAWENGLENENNWMKNGAETSKHKLIEYNERSEREKKNYKYEFGDKFMSSWHELHGDTWLNIKKLANDEKKKKKQKSNEKKKKKKDLEKKQRQSKRIKNRNKNVKPTDSDDSDDSDHSD